MYIHLFQIMSGCIDKNGIESCVGVTYVHFTATVSGEMHLVYLFLSLFVIYPCVLRLLQCFTVMCLHNFDFLI
jgi:hypothetical protein